MTTHARDLLPRLRPALLALACSAATPSALADDVGRALGGFLQQIARPQQPAQPAAPQNAAGALLGNLVGGGNAVAPVAGNKAAQAIDIVSLLSQSLDQIDEPREIEIGRQLAAVLLGSKRLSPDMALQNYVNRLGRWISLQSSRPNLPWTFAVLDDPGYNAFAAPGGYVFVTRGLVDQVQDEAELAGILAHEIVHVTSKHHLQAMRKNARAGALTQLVGTQLGNNLGGAVSAQLLSLGRDMYARGLDQGDEFEADRAGVALAAAAGFDPYGLLGALQQLRTAAPDNPAFTLALATHPPAQVRLDQLEQAMGNRLDAYAGAAPVTVPQRLQLLAAANRPQAATRPAPPAKAAPAANASRKKQ
ncbi:MAG: M48 family metalloprotease [Burkholderiaceae bacterium]|nr:M48 family metalloprotease [Burkholderiaceae bacterium]